jgi:hypothetical protein
VKGFRSVVLKRPKVQGRKKYGVMCSEVQGSEVKLLSWVKSVYNPFK